MTEYPGYDILSLKYGGYIMASNAKVYLRKDRGTWYVQLWWNGKPYRLTDDIRATLYVIRGIGGYVFRNRHGRPYTSDISRIWNEARDKINAPRVTLYEGTRHSFATQHPEYLDLVGQVLGHSRPDMTARYRKLNLDKIRGLVAARKKTG